MENILKLSATRLKQQLITAHFTQNSNRFDEFSLSAAGLFLDYSKQNVNEQVLQQLYQWADERQLAAKTCAMFNGEKINGTEGRAVLHSILRAPKAMQQQVLTPELAEEVTQTEQQMTTLVNELINGQLTGYNNQPFTDVIAVGIGGSYYGAKVCYEALKPYHQSKLKVHFLANVDGGALTKTLSGLNAATTLVVIISKTFVTQETMLNATALKQWLLDNGCTNNKLARHLLAVSAAPVKAEQFGVAANRILPMWDWVGGRFSLWSAVGFPLACAIGMDNFNQLNDGAWQMDQHFKEASFEQNMPVILALTGIWNCSFLNYPSLAILPYDHSLRAIPGYLQQLDMESNGKRVDVNGSEVSLTTAPVVFGQEGTNGQHAFMQLMHQSNDIVPAEFIVPLQGHGQFSEHHQVLVANCFAQSEALMQGKTLAQAKQELIEQGVEPQQIKALAPHKVMPGNSPSSTITFDLLTPQVMGSLMALYEHKIFVQGVMWNLNSFDQWGVELGKQLGNSVLAMFNGQQNEQLSGSTQGLISRFKKVTQ